MHLYSRLVVFHGKISRSSDGSEVGYFLGSMLLWFATCMPWVYSFSGYPIITMLAGTLLVPIPILILEISWRRSKLAHISRLIIFHGQRREREDEKRKKLVEMRTDAKKELDERAAQLQRFLKPAPPLDLENI